MKLRPEHVGRKVKLNNGQPLTVKAVLDRHVWLADETGEPCTYLNDDWQLVDDPKPEKKPSERINEIQSRLLSLSLGAQGQSWEKLQLYAICEYLDEEFAKRETK